jgi:hypothetical protein
VCTIPSWSNAGEHLTNNILVREQFGFRDGASTQSAIFNLTDSIFKAWNNKELVAGVFCDLTRAFDCNHDLLIRKLEYYEIKGSTLKWLETYLFIHSFIYSFSINPVGSTISCGCGNRLGYIYSRKVQLAIQ